MLRKYEFTRNDRSLYNQIFHILLAARAAKIPRSIRAPFRNTEMMTARGFGKRSQTSKFKEGGKMNECFSFRCM